MDALFPGPDVDPLVLPPVTPVPPTADPVLPPVKVGLLYDEA